MSIFEKDKDGWLIDQSEKDRKGKIIVMDFAVGIYETQDDQAEDKIVEYNRKSKTTRSPTPTDTKSKIYKIASNPTIRLEEFNGESGEDIKKRSILNAVSGIRKKAIREIDEVLLSYVDEYYSEMDIDLEQIK